jgi:hypothetical protein
MVDSGFRGWRRMAIVLLLGPLPVGVLAYCAESLHVPLKDNPAAITAAFGAMWGLTAGVLRKSLLRAFIGLNLGAALGLSFAALANPKESTAAAALLLVAHGAVLCACLNFERAKTLPSLLRGFFVGAMSFGVLGITGVAVTKFFRPNALGWTVMSIVPFGLGMYLYLLLIAGKSDALPKSTAAGAPHG